MVAEMKGIRCQFRVQQLKDFIFKKKKRGGGRKKPNLALTTATKHGLCWLGSKKANLSIACCRITTAIPTRPIWSRDDTTFPKFYVQPNKDKRPQNIFTQDLVLSSSAT